MNSGTKHSAEERFVRPKKAAELLSISRRTIYRMREDKQLTIIKVRGCACIAVEELNAFMRKRAGGSAT
jgi:excisionase family DNA binding protein